VQRHIACQRWKSLLEAVPALPTVGPPVRHSNVAVGWHSHARRQRRSPSLLFRLIVRRQSPVASFRL